MSNSQGGGGGGDLGWGKFETVTPAPNDRSSSCSWCSFCFSVDHSAMDRIYAHHPVGRTVVLIETGPWLYCRDL